MKAYLVGGAVRDKLLGKEPKDFDYVVLDASSEDMLTRGFQKVGISFSVFLHPETKHEYALPRGNSLEEDLSRRDLTINAMAMDSNGQLIDPFHGAEDLKDKILRHVSDAFEDDLFRIYRIMRFKTSYPDFTIAPETLVYLKKLVKTAEFKLLTAERIIKELKVVLGLSKPSIFFEGLKQIDGLSHFFPELEALIDVPQSPKYHPEGDAWTHTMLVLDHSAKLTEDILVRYSALVHDLGKGITPKEVLPSHIGHEETGIKLVQEFGGRILVPNDWTEAAIVVTRFHLRVHRLQEMKASSIVRMFYEMDAFRKPHLVNILAEVCHADEMGKFKEGDPSVDKLRNYFEIIKNVSAKDIGPEVYGPAVGEAIRAERVRVLKRLTHSTQNQ